jgi:chromosome partitioning protein
MKILTIANQKGGVGKTTSVLNFGQALSQKGHRVLLIDGDPQGNLTSYLGVTTGSGNFSELKTLDEIYITKRPLDLAAKRQFIASIEGSNGKLSLIAGDAALANVEYYLFNRPDRESVLATFLDSMKNDFDFVLIDTPPNLGLLTINALCASDGVIIPMQTEFFSLEGIVKIQNAIETVRARWNSKLEILGILPTQVNKRRKLTLEVLEMLNSQFGELVFKSFIHDNAAVAESSGHAKSVIEYDRSSQGAKDYLAASEELFQRASGETVKAGLAVRTTEEKQNTQAVRS